MSRQETGKRMVSKNAYAVGMGKKAYFWVTGCLWITAGGWGIFCLSVSIISALATISLDAFAMTLVIGAMIGSIVLLLLPVIHGLGSINKGNTLDPGILLINTNTANLPASDSLVRASQESLQAQQSVLLRAAMETTEKQKDELLRASVEEEE